MRLPAVFVCVFATCVCCLDTVSRETCGCGRDAYSGTREVRWHVERSSAPAMKVQRSGMAGWSGDLIVGREGEEFDEGAIGDQVVEDGGSAVEGAGVVLFVAELVAELG